MSDNDPVAEVGPVKILTSWEGPAILAPGVLFGERLGKDPSADGDAAGLAAWIAVSALSGENVHPVCEAHKARAQAVLADWRQRFGQAKVDEVKSLLWQQLEESRPWRKITDEELRRRIDRLFS